MLVCSQNLRRTWTRTWTPQSPAAYRPMVHNCKKIPLVLGYLANYHKEGDTIGLIHVHQLPSLPAMGLYGTPIWVIVFASVACTVGWAMLGTLVFLIIQFVAKQFWVVTNACRLRVKYKLSSGGKTMVGDIFILPWNNNDHLTPRLFPWTFHRALLVWDPQKVRLIYIKNLSQFEKASLLGKV